MHVKHKPKRRDIEREITIFFQPDGAGSSKETTSSFGPILAISQQKPNKRRKKATVLV